MSSRTVYSLLQDAAEVFGARPALHQPIGGGRYRTWSWIEYRIAAEEIAAGLRTLGIRKGDIVALHSETRAEFYLADLGVMTNGSIAAAMYTSYPPEDLARTLRACDACALFVDEPKTLDRLKQALAGSFQGPWILLTGEAPGVLTLDALREAGRKAIAKDPGMVERITTEVKPADIAILYLTSGATGDSKMGITSHAAVVTNAEMGPTVLKMGPEDSVLAFLPSAHITQRLVVELLPIACGIPVWFSASLMSLPHELQSIKPTLFVAPPRLWERIYTTICAEVRKRPAYARKIFYGAMGLGLEAARLRQEGKPLPRWMQRGLRLADRLAFRKIRARFGGRLKVAASGSAPLGKELANFYMGIGQPLIEGYGLTEGGVVILSPLDRPKAGAIGKPLPGVEIRLTEDKELLIRSATVFSGYYKDPEATGRVLRDGWLYTGDTAEIDDEGYIFITGRKKELIIMSNGKKIFPARVENLFRVEPLVSNVLLVGDRLPYLAALITVNSAEAQALKGMESFKGNAPEALAEAAPVVAEVHKAVRRVNKHLAPFEQVRKFRILPRDFSIDQGELTATLKVRRSRALENFREAVAELYAGKEESA